MNAEKIALITDSTCDLPDELLQKLNAWMLPLKIIYKDRIFADRLEIKPQEVYNNFSREVPTTSQPSPEETRSLFEKLYARGFTHAIAIHISSGLSGTYETVKMVAGQFNKMMVEVIDSKALSLALGFLVQEASQCIQSGLCFENVIARVRKLQKNVKVYFVVKTLEYLKKGGRIGYVEGTLGQILDIKPIISINDEGKYYSFCKARGRRKSISKMVDILREQAAGKRINLAVAHGDAREEAESLLDRILNMKDLKVNEAMFSQLSPVMVVHTGPGLIGLAFHEVTEAGTGK
ncbi:DegV family protein [Desulfallas thermosapovorans]|uniref:DegV family protein with EDD domain n=1 Tax=Desulfallas thermosapovorans DSM 6562 TaxID=1121431 RepID=A0A5S4ZUX4_9FIRM|nr:DegV family protein [Desulfallas thermosapovorans]TYO96015.1 DegV family protein with EDD domain [Desulfallas thermosapovorans DSM 6562]